MGNPIPIESEVRLNSSPLPFNAAHAPLFFASRVNDA
jgi:hypothetical protein